MYEYWVTVIDSKMHVDVQVINKNSLYSNNF